MIDGGRAMVTTSIALGALLVACGQTRDETLTIDAPGGAAGASSAASLGGAGAAAGSSAAGGTGALGGARATRDPEPPVADANVSGRWAMIGFEDPVGVALSQNEGALSGIGCGAGTPPASNASYCSADLTGTIAGNSLKFDFKSTAEILPGRYLADLVASEDGKRMAGRFGVGTSISNDLWTAWLPVQGDDLWLRVPEGEPPYRGQVLDLRLTSAEPGDPRFDPKATYRVVLGPYGLVGDLGAFFVSEMSRTGDGVVEAGPVSPTVPELPVYVSFASSGDAYTSVTARLSNGHTFTFDVLPFL